ncbi:MAG: hypothetical protein ACTSUR_03770 [Candidatus Heimdallarchaeaceae archaeon]
MNISSNAYYFVETGIITAYALEYTQNFISSELEKFENKIYSIETAIFGDIAGNLGNIGNGKIIILYANLPSGWAGYFDPSNEYSQVYLDSISLDNRFSNE